MSLPRNLKTPEDWQLAVDAAAGMRVIADCMMYGLITGPEINVGVCDEILARGRKRGITPSLPATDLAKVMILEINSSLPEYHPMGSEIAWTLPKLKRFKAAYAKAAAAGQDQFRFEGHDFHTGFARYFIIHLEAELVKNKS